MIKIITAPAAYPATLAEVQTWCRIDAIDDSDDALIEMLIASMTAYAEHLTGRAFVERTLELNLQHFSHCIELPWAPLIGIDSISYLDADRTLQTVDAADYQVDTVSQPGRVQPVYGESWPAIGYGFNPVRIQYRAGYAAPGSPTDLTDNTYLPGQLRTWLKARICTLYDQREQLVIGNGNAIEIPRGFADGLLDPLIIGTRFF